MSVFIQTAAFAILVALVVIKVLSRAACRKVTMKCGATAPLWCIYYRKSGGFFWLNNFFFFLCRGRWLRWTRMVHDGGWCTLMIDVDPRYLAFVRKLSVTTATHPTIWLSGLRWNVTVSQNSTIFSMIMVVQLLPVYILLIWGKKWEGSVNSSYFNVINKNMRFTRHKCSFNLNRKSGKKSDECS